MKAQRLEFERTAKAQEALAESQRDLAEAQKFANKAHEAAALAALRNEHAQRCHSVATLVACISQTRTAIHVETHRSGNPNFPGKLASELDWLETNLREQRAGVADAEKQMALADEDRDRRGLGKEEGSKNG